MAVRIESLPFRALVRGAVMLILGWVVMQMGLVALITVGCTLSACDL